MGHPVSKEAITSPTFLAFAFFCSHIYIIFHDITFFPVYNDSLPSLKIHPLPIQMDELIPRSHVCAMWFNVKVRWL